MWIYFIYSLCWLQLHFHKNFPVVVLRVWLRLGNNFSAALFLDLSHFCIPPFLHRNIYTTLTLRWFAHKPRANYMWWKMCATDCTLRRATGILGNWVMLSKTLSLHHERIYLCAGERCAFARGGAHYVNDGFVFVVRVHYVRFSGL